MYPETDLEVDPVEWLESVEAAIQEASGDVELARNVDFLRRLDPLADTDPAEVGFAAFVREAVAEHTREAEAPQLERIDGGRVLEARGTSNDGGRIFRVQIIRAGESKNGRNYPASVLKTAAKLYDGAKAFDRHRTPDELKSSTISGLVGFYRNVEAAADGLYADLHLLPSATHTAEALDASVAAQAAGLPPIVGISHDAMTVLKHTSVGGRRVQEAVRITKVHSADVVADPAAGGKATRVLAGGIDETDPESNQEEDVTVTSEAVLAALKEATPEQLAGFGLSKVTEAAPAPPPAGSVDKSSFMAGLMISQKVSEAQLPAAVGTQIREALPQHVTESDVDSQITALKAALGVAERAGLAPTVTVQVTQEARQKKVDALDAFFAGDYSKGYRSFQQAYMDFTGYRPAYLGREDLSRQILRESFGSGFDSGVATRSTESGDTSTWAQVLGDSVTRRMVAEYSNPSLQTWRSIVSSTVPVMDFRTQRVGRIGGYGVLPTVNQGAPYQPLTTPGDEEATYALVKKGGTEDVTLEMIANDDVRAIQRIPGKLGRAAAQTLYRFVWDMLISGNGVTCTYDSVALFDAAHANTDTSSALSQTTLSVGRRKMIEQAAYGNSVEILGLTPKYLIVPPELEELAFQLCTSAVAVPATPAGASDTPNIHQANGLRHILLPYATDANDWFLVADPSQVPTIEVGFYQGKEEPELFTQSDPNSGSVFNADVFTWKCRFIFSGTALDHRGFYRGQG
ncbi:phage major capsid protein [Catelliglobosispora koreensis]|uniref:phage major capsid protein n=1 Tax=Catelliglobosispora koreensis TaxID=129052 RepID=UPI00037FCE59|nr:hypothetical protein [Catelliglobosispora koreensis]